MKEGLGCGLPPANRETEKTDDAGAECEQAGGFGNIGLVKSYAELPIALNSVKDFRPITDIPFLDRYGLVVPEVVLPEGDSCRLLG